MKHFSDQDLLQRIDEAIDHCTAKLRNGYYLHPTKDDPNGNPQRIQITAEHRRHTLDFLNYARDCRAIVYRRIEKH